MSKTRTKCHCGEQYVMVDESKAALGGTESCGAATCVEPSVPSEIAKPVTRPQHDRSGTPGRHSSASGSDLF